MSNGIPEKQNTPEHIQRLAAQRALYSKAKKIAGLQAILSVPAAITWSIVASFEPGLKSWAAVWGLIVTILDVGIFDTLQSRCQKDAAKIQETFDCSVLDIPWNSLIVGARPDPERIVAAAQTYKPDPKHPLENWYPCEVGGLPLPSARFACQRTNLWWDWELRQRYGALLLIGAILLFVSTFATALLRHLSLEDFLLTFWVPLSPAYVWALREFRKHQSAAKLSETLKTHVESLLGRAKNGGDSDTELKEESRKVQDQIYMRRRDSALVFDWIYKRLHASHEMQATKGAADLVRESLDAGKDHVP